MILLLIKLTLAAILKSGFVTIGTIVLTNSPVY